MNVQVMGWRGMLGEAVCQAVERRGHTLIVKDCNIETMIANSILAPVVINCAGLVKQRQYPASRFMAVNAVGPHRLAEACDAVGARLIHVSTDCVFQGRGLHSEESTPDATDVYARSKLAGEVGAPHLTVRTSFIGFGTRGLLYDLQQQQTVHASNRLLWSGHTVETVADALVTLAESNAIGLLHLPGEFQSRWELCQKLQARFDLRALIIRDDEYEADRRLISHAWPSWLLPALPSFDTQLEAMDG